MKTQDGTQYCRFMRGIYDCNEQDYWSKYVTERFGKHIDPYWTTELDENNVLKDVMFVKESVRYNSVK